jgi:hypothetical protein
MLVVRKRDSDRPFNLTAKEAEALSLEHLEAEEAGAAHAD